jgi:hypothetical protein
VDIAGIIVDYTLAVGGASFSELVKQPLTLDPIQSYSRYPLIPSYPV